MTSGCHGGRHEIAHLIPNAFRAVDGVWLSAAEDAPGGDVALGEGAGVSRFVLDSSEDSPITSQTAIRGLRVEPEVELEGAELFAPPDVPCASNDACATDDGFMCGSATGADARQELSRCLSIPGVTITGPARFVSDITSDQVLGILMENTSSLRGALPMSVSQSFADLDGDGLGDQDAPERLDAMNRERATDRNSRRETMLLDWRVAWNSLRSEASGDREVRSLFGLWTFSGSRDAIRELTDGGWVEEERTASMGVTRYQSDGDAREATQAAVFESMLAMMDPAHDGPFADDDVDGFDKQLVVFVDGPDERRDPALGPEQVITAARALGVKIFVVHLDNSVSTTAQGGTPTFVDDPAYTERQPGFEAEAQCDCKRFEECRTVTAFSTAPGEPVSIPAQGVDRLYCVPSRDANGRIGPVEDYAHVAAATGGGYLYLTDPMGMTEQVEWLPYALDGTWELPVRLDAVANRAVPGDAMYQVSAVTSVSVDDSTFTYSSTLGATSSSAEVDNRLVIGVR